jgi:hypothetical protein
VTAPTPDRADVLKRTPTPSMLTAYGDLYRRLTRAWQVLAAVDPQTTQIPAPELDPRIVPTALLGDFTAPPFRTNGVGISAFARMPASGGATFETLFFNNPVISDPGAPVVAYVLDELRVGGGASEFFYAFASILALTPTRTGFFTESRQDPTQATSGTVRTPSAGLQVASSNNAAIFSSGVTADIVGQDATLGGNNPYTKIDLRGQYILWPGVALAVQHLTANLTLNAVLVGRWFVINVGGTGQNF